MSGKRLLLILLAAALSMPACSNNDNPIITPTLDNRIPDNEQGAQLVIQPGNVNLEVGKTAKVEALLNDEEGFREDLAATTWSSLDPDIVSVDSQGTITALKLGNAKVRAELLGQTAEVLVSVSAASPNPPVAVDAGGSAGAETPTQDGNLGLADEDSEASPELAKLRTIVIRPENESVQPTIFKFSRLDEQRQFVAVGKDSEAQDIENLTFSWTSSNENVATVNSTGLVTAVATGTTNLTATAGNVTSNIVQIQVQEGTIRANIRFME